MSTWCATAPNPQDGKRIVSANKGKPAGAASDGNSSNTSSSSDSKDKKDAAVDSEVIVLVAPLEKAKIKNRVTAQNVAPQTKAQTQELITIRAELQIKLSAIAKPTSGAAQLQRTIEQANKEAKSLNTAPASVMAQPVSVAMRPVRPFESGYNRFDQRSPGGPSPHVLATQITHRMQRINTLTQQIAQYKQQRPLINGVSLAQHMQRIQQQSSQDLAAATRQLEKQLEKYVGIFEEKYHAIQAKYDKAHENLKEKVAVLFPLGIPEGVDERQYILQNGSRSADEALIAADEAQLALMQFEDRIAFCKAAIELNKQQLKNYAVNEFGRASAKNEQAVTREEHEKVLAELMVRHEKLRTTNTKRNTEINDLRVEYENVFEQIENTWFWGKSALLEQKTRLEAQLDGLVPLQLAKQAEFEALHEAVNKQKNYIKSIEHDDQIRVTWATHGQAVIDELSATHSENKALLAAIQQTQHDGGVIRTAKFELKPSVAKILTKNGIDVNSLTQHTGSSLQLYVHDQLMSSLNAIDGIDVSNPQVSKLVKDAALINISGQKLNDACHIAQAIVAKDVCDTLIAYAQAVVELGQEIARGVAVGAFVDVGGDIKAIAVETARLVYKTAEGALTDASGTLERIRGKAARAWEHMTHASLSIIKLACEIDEIQELAGRGDPESERLAVQKSRALTQPLVDMANRDGVAFTTARLATGFLLPGQIVKAAKKIKLLERIRTYRGLAAPSAQETLAAVQTILASSHELVGAERAAISAAVAGKDAALIEEAIGIIKNDAELMKLASKNPAKHVAEAVQHLEKNAIKAKKINAREIAGLVNENGVVSEETRRYWESLMPDPDQGNKIILKSVDEAIAGIAAERQGFLQGPLTRDPRPGGGEFIDKFGQVWDVKSAPSRADNGRYILKAKDVIKSIRKDLLKGENIILDLSKTEKADIVPLCQKISTALTQDEIKRVIVAINTEIMEGLTK